jgi:hypothetical protein
MDDSFVVGFKFVNERFGSMTQREYELQAAERRSHAARHAHKRRSQTLHTAHRDLIQAPVPKDAESKKSGHSYRKPLRALKPSIRLDRPDLVHHHQVSLHYRNQRSTQALRLSPFQFASPLCQVPAGQKDSFYHAMDICEQSPLPPKSSSMY